MDISSCIKEIFGLDVDVFSWDFGKSMTLRPETLDAVVAEKNILGQSPNDVLSDL